MKPILFSTAMVQAILDGRKTQTRRVIKPEWIRCLDPEDDRDQVLAQSPYQVGMNLWVRETWAYRAAGIGYVYRADGEQSVERWKPSIFMPREACRLMLEVTGVRVERVQEISEKDAMREGAKYAIEEVDDDFNCTYSYREGFKELWNSINAKRGYGWDVNPFVLVIDFKV